MAVSADEEQIVIVVNQLLDDFLLGMTVRGFVTHLDRIAREIGLRLL